MKKIYCCAVLLLLLTSSNSLAQIPGIVAYQGFITSKDSALNGTFDVNLNIYNQSTGGSSVWSQKNGGVQVVKGYYTVLMNFDQNWQNNYVDFHGQYWLEAQVGGTTLTPRVQLTASPFTINARRADTAAVALKLVQDAPIGTIVAYAGQALGLPIEKQTGWYVCDGSSVAVTDYPAYASAIGSIYGTTPDGLSVYLPDLRGLFLRGVTGTRSDSLADPDASSRFALNGRGLAGNQVGSIQDDAFQGHYHTLGEPSAVGVGQGLQGSNMSLGGAFNADAHIAARAATPVTDSPDISGKTVGPSGWPRTSSESRPKNAYVYWLIKVR